MSNPKRIVKTQEQIDAEISALLELAPKLRPSFFGDSNQAAAQTQAQVLCERMSGDLIELIWGDDDYLYVAAREAYDWMRGADDSEGLADSWRSLIASE